ncbi:MAG: hemolysin family protein [Spirochaetes bacterium]|nr:hemolysin family protein [Spirochaetota bacterium]
MVEQSSFGILAFIVILVVLVGFSAFFAACEMAFSSLNRSKLKNMAGGAGAGGGKSRRAKAALKLLDSYEKILSSALIGSNIANIAASAIATLLFVQMFGTAGVTVAAVIVTFVMLVFGDISPKTLAKESPELTALRSAPLLRFFIFVFAPINFFTSAWKKLIMKVFPKNEDSALTEGELLAFVEEVRQEGGINKQEELMIREVIEFDELTVAEVFTPRVNVVAVSENAGAAEIDLLFAQTGFSRLPVFRDSIDNITGVIILKDFYHNVAKGQKTPAEIVKPVVWVTQTMKAAKLLKTMQEKRAHIAVAVDEFGGTLGIVTMEDIVEELVGEIWDEHDKVVEAVRKTDDGGFAVMGGTSFKDMLQQIAGGAAASETAGGVEPGEPDEEAPLEGVPATTVGNWVMENSGSVPQAGEEFVFRNFKIIVSKVLRHRVMEVIVSFNGRAGQKNGKK